MGTPDDPIPDGVTRENLVCRIRGTGRLSQRHGYSEKGQALARQAEVDNLEFIAHAREDVPALIREVEHLRNLLKAKS